MPPVLPYDDHAPAKACFAKHEAGASPSGGHPLLLRCLRGQRTGRVRGYPHSYFTPQASHDLTHVLLRLYRNGSDPTEKFFCQIQPTAAGKPTYPFLGQSWFLQDELTLYWEGAWKEITFDPVIPLQAGVMYAIVCWTSNNVPPEALWRNDANVDSYPRGTLCFSYDGSTWTIQAPGDARFQEFGYPA